MTIKPEYSLTNFGFTFDSEADCTRQEMEFHIQSRFQGIHAAGVDYVFQPRYPSTTWQVNGTTPIGCRATASTCRGFALTPNRIDVTVDIPNNLLDFDTVTRALAKWFKDNKPTTTQEVMEVAAGRRAVYGTRKSRFSLIVQEAGADSGEISITWNMRLDKVLPAYYWLNTNFEGADFYEACRNTFAACTNSILGDDFFGLGLSTVPRLEPTLKADVKEDWWGYLSAVAGKIRSQSRKEKSDFLAVESVKFIEDQILKLIAKDAKELNEKAVRGTMKE